MKKTIREYLILTVATLLVSSGVYFFKFPNNFTTGGVSGISLILGKIVPAFTPGMFIFIFNMALLVIGVLVIGKSFGTKTIYCSILLSLSISLFERFIPLSSPLTGQPMLELCFSVLLPAFGSAVLFNLGASTGGTDVAAMILKKHTNLNIGTALLCSDIIIVCAAFVVFGVETWLFSVLGLILKALVVDNVIEGLNLSKVCNVITTENTVIEAFIKDSLRRGATVSDCKGSFTDKDKKMILTVLDRRQAALLRKFVLSVDPEAFVIITNSNNIIGKGFRQS